MCMKKDASKVKCWKLWNVISLHWSCTPEKRVSCSAIQWMFIPPNPKLNIIRKFQDNPTNWVWLLWHLISYLTYPCTWGTWEFYVVHVWLNHLKIHPWDMWQIPVSTIHLCDWSIMIMCIYPCNIQMWKYNFMNVIFIHTKFLYCSLFNTLRSFWKLQLLQILYHHGYQHFI
jgi:hypothetical protein